MEVIHGECAFCDDMLIFDTFTACGHRIAYRKWKETKVHPGTARPGNMLGCSLFTFHFLWAILFPQAVWKPP